MDINEAQKKICPFSLNRPDSYYPDHGQWTAGLYYCYGDKCMAWKRFILRNPMTWTVMRDKNDQLIYDDQSGECCLIPERE